MSITEKNIVRHEIIGLSIKIVGSKDPNQVGIKGKVVDETQKMFTIRTAKKEKKIAKKDNVFEIEIPSKEIVKIDGKLLHGRPEERIIKKLPKKWDVLK